MAGMDRNRGDHVFRFEINGRHLLDYKTGKNIPPVVTAADGSKLSFFLMSNDQFGDAFGYMLLSLPVSGLQKGTPVTIKVTGENASSQAWLMTFRCTDAARFLVEQAKYEGWLDLEIEQKNAHYTGTVKTPEKWTGRKITIAVGDDHNTLILKKQPEGKTGMNFTLPETVTTSANTFKIFLDTAVIARVPGLFWQGEKEMLGSETLITAKGKTTDKKWKLEVRIGYAPQLVHDLREISGSLFRNGEILIMNSSHQDIAWMDAPEKCIVDRDTMLITPLLREARKNPYYRFNIEDVLMIREYLHRHPEKKEIVAGLLKHGQIQCGASYNMPYEEMYAGESLLRQFYLGKRWLMHQFPGYDPVIYWNVDVPGRTLQMPQILKKSGVPYLVLSRQNAGLYHWYSPDSSFITVYSPGHYAGAYTDLNQGFEKAAFLFGREEKRWKGYYPEPVTAPVIPVLSDWDMSPAKNYSDLISQWSSLCCDLTLPEGKDRLRLPRIEIASAETFFRKVSGEKVKYGILRGERPDIWIYIHGPAHQKAIRESRKGDMLLPAAEKFSTVNAILEHSFVTYPDEKLEKAWEDKIYPDHGWGGKHGETTDALFYDKLASSVRAGEEILQTQLSRIAGKIVLDKKGKIPIVIFNSLSWERTDPVTVKIKMPDGFAKEIILMDPYGKQIPCQIKNRRKYKNGFLREADITFLADHVPSVGYKTFYILKASKVLKPGNTALDNMPEFIESPFYKISFSRHGIRQIFDKQLKKNLFDESKFAVGEVITLHSAGNGAGEFADVQQPDTAGYDHTGAYTLHWKVLHDGPVFISVEYKQPLDHAVVRQRIVLYKKTKKIDFFTDLLNWDGTMFREFRQVFPVIAQPEQVRYEVPFGSVQIGKDELQQPAGERYIYPPSETRPRGIQNWIAAETSEVTVLFSSSVAAWDYRDPTGNPLATALLQPILLASRKSCHGEGNDYDQTGDHAFFFSMTSFRPDINKTFRLGRQPNEPLFALVDPCVCEHASLPEEYSFFSVDKNNVMISAIKKSEEEDAFILRCFEPSGKTVEATFHSALPFHQLWHTDLIENNPHEMKNESHRFSMKINPYSIETFKIGLRGKRKE